MKYGLLIFYLILTQSVSGQHSNLFQKAIQIDWYFDREVEEDKYYPENKFVRENKIYLKIDSSEFSKPHGYWMNAYDKKGRLICETFTKMSDLENPFIYIEKADTLFRFKYRSGKKLYSVERFIYNKKGKIVRYEECRNWYGYKDAFTVSIDLFFYSRNGSLESKLHYYKDKYSGVLNENLQIDLQDVKITDGIHYQKIKNQNGTKTIVGNHIIGKLENRFTDTIVFDRNNRLLAYNNFVKSGSMGCMMGSNINRKTKINYTTKTIKTISTQSNCVFVTHDNKCIDKREHIENESLTLYNEKGLKTVRYGFRTIKDIKEKYIRTKYAYTFYQ
jgi:hypothetical protein